ncbi:MAG: polymer-forming cytoskeletal protein [Gammaproteobacteria bacterium]|uniref:polymer-forming cytoskeletal protein n=1 Tax=Pseudomaricurvus alcaniphilus TaxID=1166482 RepID=UPI00140DB520|nr:polymer-forming cytoskeletal protein [Gammaproteobacteria bacterium]NHN38893.1 polymer-forming cytoskeletal protein [Pseudomaricurvus alcaniphilus]
MWGKKDGTVGFASGSTTLISKTTELVGDVHFSGNLEVEGRIKGNVSAEEGSDARIRIMEQGVIEGEIHVPTIVVNGLVKGNVHSSKHVELAAKATVQGNVHYSVIEMVKGSQVNGNLVYIEGDKPAQAAFSIDAAVNKRAAKADTAGNSQPVDKVPTKPQSAST